MKTTRIAFATSLLLLAALPACRQQPTDAPAAPPQAAVPETASAPADTPVVATETTLATPGMQQRDAGFDAKAFAGTFEGTLPCADCPGMDERLELTADGAFTLTDSYRERPGSEQVLRGSWSAEPDGKRIRLDPGSKDAVDRLYAIAEDGTLVPLGADGAPTGAPGDPRLRRSR
jgi:copper homeostasis protein (lipoprotein)